MSSILVGDIKKSIPMALKQKNMFTSGAISRTTRSYGAVTASVSPNGNQIATFNLTGFGWIDPQGSYFKGVLSYLQGMVLGRSIHSTIERIQIRSTAGVVLFDVSGYNVLTSMIADATLSETELENSFSITTLSGTPSYRASLYAGADFCFQPLIQMLRSTDYLPLHYMGGLVIDFHLAQAGVAFQNTSTTLSTADLNFQLDKLRYVVDIITFDEETEALARSAFTSGKLSFNYQSWRHSPDMSQAQNFDLKLETINNSVNGLLIAMRPASAISNPSADSFARCCNSLDDVQITVGADLKDIYSGASQFYTELEKLLDSPQSGTITPSNWMNGDGSKFMIGQNLQTVQDASFISGYSGRGAIVVKFNYSNPLPEAVSYYNYVLHDVVITCSAQNGVQALW